MAKKPTDKQATVNDSEGMLSRLIEALKNLISEVPESDEKTSSAPLERSRQIANKAAIQAAVTSGGLALPPGPLGLLTIFPDLMAIWHIQRQMVSDIASAFGKKSQLRQQEMLYCLFRHTASHAFKSIFVKVGERVLVKRASLRFIQNILNKIGIRLTQRLAGKAISRWLPAVGAVGVGVYAYYDTAQVGKTTIELFKSDIVFEDNPT